MAKKKGKKSATKKSTKKIETKKDTLPMSDEQKISTVSNSDGATTDENHDFSKGVDITEEIDPKLAKRDILSGVRCQYCKTSLTNEHLFKEPELLNEVTRTFLATYVCPRDGYIQQVVQIA